MTIMIPLHWNIEERALGIMLNAHAGQTDKNGEPYIFHPMRVASYFSGEQYYAHRAVALLHDVIEDSDMTLETGVIAELPFYIRASLAAITRKDNEFYHYYIERLALNEIARMVKCIDIKDNMHPDRQSALPIEKSLSLMKRYSWAIHYLINWEENTYDNDQEPQQG